MLLGLLGLLDVRRRLFCGILGRDGCCVHWWRGVCIGWIVVNISRLRHLASKWQKLTNASIEVFGVLQPLRVTEVCLALLLSRDIQGVSCPPLSMFL